MEMIPKREFGRTGHRSSRVIFGSWALNNATKAEADRALALLLDYGVNHIDTAPMYGNAERLIGPWLAKHRDEFFIATKTRCRLRRGALTNLKESLGRLRVDHIDLWQMHGLTGSVGWETAMGPGGVLDTFIEARDKGLVRYLGVTGHGIKAAEMHLRSLARFHFDSVMLPYNYTMMQKPNYAAQFNALEKTCRRRRVAMQVIKAIARRPRSGPSKEYNTYFYEPLVPQEAIDTAVHWVLGNPDAFLVTVGDMELLPKVLDAADRFKIRPSRKDMIEHAKEYAIKPVFK